jgi:hypothetical protein
MISTNHSQTRTRGPRGQGTQRERRPGVWEIRIPTTPDPLTGRARQLSVTVHGTEQTAEAQRRLLVAQHRVLPGLPPPHLIALGAITAGA